MPFTPEPDATVRFSLFSGDWLNRAFAWLGVPEDARYRVLKRSVIVVFLTWIPVALLALYGGLAGGGSTTTNFFADFAAHAQFLIAMPLFMLAEPIVEASTRDSARQFITCGIIRLKIIRGSTRSTSRSSGCASRTRRRSSALSSPTRCRW